MTVKLSKKFVCAVSLLLTIIAVFIIVLVFLRVGTTSSTVVAALDHTATALFSTRSNKVKRSKELARIKANSTVKQVGLFTDLCEIMTRKKSSTVYNHPNVVHYVKLTEHSSAELTFSEFISILSVHKYYKPERIVIHSNAQNFQGIYWKLVQELGTTVDTELTERIRAIGREKARPHWITHEADVIKVQTMLKQGGVYMDFDVVILNGTRFRASQRLAECVIGTDTDPCTRLCAGFMSCVQNSSFVEDWLYGYQEDYQPYLWVYNAGTVPSNLLRNCANCYDVYVDRTISNIKEVQGNTWLQKNGVDWKSKAVVHYMYHSSQVTPKGLLTSLSNTPLGEMFTYVLDDYLPTLFNSTSL